jgi:hypothetical protein
MAWGRGVVQHSDMDLVTPLMTPASLASFISNRLRHRGPCTSVLSDSSNAPARGGRQQ